MQNPVRLTNKMNLLTAAALALCILVAAPTSIAQAQNACEQACLETWLKRYHLACRETAEKQQSKGVAAEVVKSRFDACLAKMRKQYNRCIGKCS